MKPNYERDQLANDLRWLESHNDDEQPISVGEIAMKWKSIKPVEYIPADTKMFGICSACQTAIECRYDECKKIPGMFNDTNVWFAECKVCKEKSLARSLLKANKSGTAVIMTKKIERREKPDASATE